jgi:hypothetical protein
VAREEGILERVEQALGRGEVWRAKEMLRGNIGSRGYSPRLYERYGRLLLELDEKYEAGKYLFLSAQRCAEYEDAISRCLARARKCSPRAIISSLPKGARLGDVSEYPEPLQSDLAQMGLKGAVRKIVATPPRPGTGERLLLLGCAVAAAVAIVSAIVGFSSLVDRVLGR